MCVRNAADYDWESHDSARLNDTWRRTPIYRTLLCWSRLAVPKTALGEVARFDSFMFPNPPSTSYAPADIWSVNILASVAPC